MPTDLAFSNDRLVQVRDRAGTGLPFSKGLMATSILATGLETDRAYAIAAEIQRKVARREVVDFDADDLADLAAAVITRSAGRRIAAGYRARRHVKRAARPVLLVECENSRAPHATDRRPRARTDRPHTHRKNLNGRSSDPSFHDIRGIARRARNGSLA